MKDYLLFTSGKGAIVTMMSEDTSEYYGEVQNKFEAEHSTNRFDWVNMQSLWDNQKIGSMYYDYDLTHDGAYYGLYCFSGETKDQINRAKAYLKHNFDVVGITVYKIKLVPFTMPVRMENDKTRNKSRLAIAKEEHDKKIEYVKMDTELTEKELKDGDSVYYDWNDSKAPTPGQSYGRAEFSVCLQWRYGKLKRFFIYHNQQRDIKHFYRVECGGSDSFMVRSSINIEKPNVWVHGWCKEHKCPFIRVYVPDNTNKFSVSILSTAEILFQKGAKL